MWYIICPTMPQRWIFMWDNCNPTMPERDKRFRSMTYCNTFSPQFFFFVTTTSSSKNIFSKLGTPVSTFLKKSKHNSYGEQSCICDLMSSQIISAAVPTILNRTSSALYFLIEYPFFIQYPTTNRFNTKCRTFPVYVFAILFYQLCNRVF